MTGPAPDPRLDELDNLAREYFGTHRYQRRLSILFGLAPSTVNAWWSGRTEIMPEWPLVALRALVELKRYTDARHELVKATESLTRVIRRL